MKLKAEYTNDRRVRPLYCGGCYLGSYYHGKVIILPYWWKHRHEIKRHLPRGMQDLPIERGIPAARECPLEPDIPKPPKKKVAKKAARKSKTSAMGLTRPNPDKKPVEPKDEREPTSSSPTGAPDPTTIEPTTG